MVVSFNFVIIEKKHDFQKNLLGYFAGQIISWNVPWAISQDLKCSAGVVQGDKEPWGRSLKIARGE